MVTKARLKATGLSVADEINERSSIEDYSYFLDRSWHFDGNIQGKRGLGQRILTPEATWNIGSTGSQGTFYQNGTTSENSIIEAEDPWGKKTAVWRALNNDATSDADGGWNHATFSVDSTKTYRYSTWVRRTALGNGSFYLGTHGYGTTDGIYVYNGSTLNTNPYFLYTGWGGSIFPELNTWYLVVAYVHMSTYTGNIHENTGVYDRFGNKYYTPTDFKWHSSTTSSSHRSYLYYSTDSTTNQQWVYPTVHLVDGSEPTLDDLLKCRYDAINPLTDNLTYKTPMGLDIGQQTTNQILNGDGKSMSSIGWTVPGVYQPGWDATKHTKAVVIDNWASGYNSGVPSPSIGYHAHWTYDSPDGSACVFFNDNNDEFSLGHRWLGVSVGLANPTSNLGWTVGTVVTLSWLQKTDTPGKGVTPGLYHYSIASGLRSWGPDGLRTASATVINQWERKSLKFTIDSDYNLANDTTLYCYGHYGDYGKVWATDFQIEIDTVDKNTSTAYVTGTRASNAYTYLQMFPSVQNAPTVGTLIYSFIPSDSTFTSPTYIDELDTRNNSNTSNRFIIVRHEGEVASQRRVYIRDGANWRSVVVNINLGEENTIAWTWNVGSGYRIMCNGVTVLSSSSYAQGNQNVYKLFLQYNNIVKYIKLYSVYMTEDNIKELLDKPLRIGTNIVTTQEISEVGSASTPMRLYDDRTEVLELTEGVTL